MLSLVNLSIQCRLQLVTENLQAVFHEGYVYGLYTSHAGLLRPLLDCIRGQLDSYTGEIIYDKGSREGRVGFTDCSFTDCSLFITETCHGRQLRKPVPAMTLPASDIIEKHSLYDPVAITHALPRPIINPTAPIALLHDLRIPLPDLRGGKIVIINSHEYAALRLTCDYIYLFDGKRFPIVVEKADFALFDDYFEHVFR